MPTLRRATVDDASLITQHRHLMFADNDFTTEERLNEMDHAFEPWVRAALADGTYVGLFLEEDSRVLSGGGVYLMPFPPHWMHDEPFRAYLLNFYTAPEARGRGLAKQILQAAVDAAHELGASVITLHASRFGQPIYEKFGFKHSVEMMLRKQ
ncbi:GNAT family N-acetyltransferase [Granulicella cerasi]|uniref:GNAT family N-acetyltransferase n=1 Tax=Granulicella cerasi TaxID=741063 RepID=A0ABW1ZCJ2_9BACT|nr:GNAT family N-acetyltransferase [Granulicella cerasi]